MSRLSKLVREYIKCPQLDGGTEYGEWGALRLDQRKQIAKLCEEVDIFEDAADKFGKENYILKQQLAEKDKEITMLKSQNQFFMEETKRLDQISNLKDKEIERLTANQTPTDKELKPQEYDNYNLADKLRYRDSQIKIAMERLQKLDDELFYVRHKICEKIREKSEEKKYWLQTTSHIDNLVGAGVLDEEGVEYLTYYLICKTDLDKIERGE